MRFYRVYFEWGGRKIHLADGPRVKQQRSLCGRPYIDQSGGTKELYMYGHLRCCKICWYRAARLANEAWVKEGKG